MNEQEVRLTVATDDFVYVDTFNILDWLNATASDKDFAEISSMSNDDTPDFVERLDLEDREENERLNEIFEYAERKRAEGVEVEIHATLDHDSRKRFFEILKTRKPHLMALVG